MAEIKDYKKNISEIVELFNLAQSSHYKVTFGGLSSDLRSYITSKGVTNNFMSEDAGLLCYAAQIPTTKFATADIFGNYTGVSEKFVHTRMYDPITLEFYVDSKYRIIKMFESWMEFISSGSNANENSPGYFYRIKYPEQYKSNSTKIVKFDRNYRDAIEYVFFGLFPISMSSPSISYQNSDILKISVTFNYERYIIN